MVTIGKSLEKTRLFVGKGYVGRCNLQGPLSTYIVGYLLVAGIHYVKKYDQITYPGKRIYMGVKIRNTPSPTIRYHLHPFIY